MDVLTGITFLTGIIVSDVVTYSFVSHIPLDQIMSFTLTYDYDPADQPSLSWESMSSFMQIGWGSTGQKAYDDYCSFNRKFFSDQLPPAHISFSASCYGRRGSVTGVRRGAAHRFLKT